MPKTLGIVEVAQQKPGCPALSRKLGGKSILEWIVRSATDCQRLDAVVVLCIEDDLAVVRELVPTDVEVASIGSTDVLSAAMSIAKARGADALVHVSADHPFVDPVLIDRLVSTSDAHPNCEYIGYCRADGRPAILTHFGMLAEWCSLKALTQAASEATPAERRQVTGCLVAHPDKYSLRLIPMPTELDREDLRLRMIDEQDWEHAQVIYEALGPEDWDWRRIAELLASQGERAAATAA